MRVSGLLITHQLSEEAAGWFYDLRQVVDELVAFVDEDVELAEHFAGRRVMAMLAKRVLVHLDPVLHHRRLIGERQRHQVEALLPGPAERVVAA